jgi:hypothetical protein
MEDQRENKVETKKDWLVPELKKIDVQELTAAGSDGDADGAETFS